MVRLEILKELCYKYNISVFTFQYGQIRNKYAWINEQGVKAIYIPVWLDQKLYSIQQTNARDEDLHSSMVRLEIRKTIQLLDVQTKFTFQYGQIRNPTVSSSLFLYKTFTFQYGQIRNEPYLAINDEVAKIYIPVWLDQKLSNSLIIYVN